MVQLSPYRYWCLNFRSRSATLSPLARNSLLLHNYFFTTVEDRPKGKQKTKVEFKFFRPYLLRNSQERAIIAFEESDGISGYNHTPEKDAIFGLLLAIEMVAATRNGNGRGFGHSNTGCEDR